MVSSSFVIAAVQFAVHCGTQEIIRKETPMAWLRKRGKIWYIRFRDGGDKEHSISTGTHVKKIADAELVKFEEGRGDVGTKRVRLGEFVEVHLKHMEKTHSPRWLHNKTLIFKNLLIPFFGADTLLKNISKAKIEDYRLERLKKVSNRTTNIEINCLMAMLRHAVSRDELEERFIPKIKKLHEQSRRLRFLDNKEIDLLRAACLKHSPEMFVFFNLCLYAGLRLGEAFNLRWADIDLDRRMIILSPRNEWRPKSRRGRIIPIMEKTPLLEALQSWRKERPDAEKVIDSDYGEDWLKKVFKKTVKAAGLSIAGANKVTAHTLRHSYASHLVMGGVPIYTVSALLGHQSLAMTQIYAHLAPEHLTNTLKGISF